MRISDWSSDVCSSDLRAKAGAAGKIGAIGRDIDPGQHDLVEALIDQRPYPVDDKTGGGGARIATAKGDDAEGAAMVAAVLHLHERAGALGKAAEHKIGRAHAELQSLMRKSYDVFCL